MIGNSNFKENSWILDDGVKVGENADIRKVLKIIDKYGPSRGPYLLTAATQLAKSKTSTWCLFSFTERRKVSIGMDIPTIDGNGFTHLGDYIRNKAFIANNYAKRVDKVKTIIETLSSLEDAHFEYVLLSSCFSMP